MPVYKPKSGSRESRLYKLGNGVQSIRPAKPNKPLPNQLNLFETKGQSK
jgi:hypothetical protein